jgi:hypothetical protein
VAVVVFGSVPGVVKERQYRKVLVTLLLCFCDLVSELVQRILKFADGNVDQQLYVVCFPVFAKKNFSYGIRVVSRVIAERSPVLASKAPTPMTMANRLTVALLLGVLGEMELQLPLRLLRR